MKRLLAGLCGVLLLCGSAFAEESLFDKVKAVVDRTEQSGGVFYDQKAHELIPLTTTTVLKADVKGVEVAGTLSYAVDKTVLAGARTDLLADLSKIPGVQITIPWIKVHAGYNVGYSIQNDALAYGPSVDASVKF